jgi:hypothetical protein
VDAHSNIPGGLFAIGHHNHGHSPKAYFHQPCGDTPANVVGNNLYNY